MSTEATLLRPTVAVPVDPPPTVVRARRLTVVAWLALTLNALPYFANLSTALVLPGRLAQLVTQGALMLALVLALLANPRVQLKPTIFMLLLSVLSPVVLMVSLHNEYLIGSTYRALRLLLLVVVLWLLTPAWGRREGLLLKAHVLGLSIVVGTVVIGAVMAPGPAFSYGGRLSGSLWPMPPTQVAHYAAVLLGILALLWMTRVIPGRWAGAGVVICTAVLIATHTRTAILALVLGLTVAVASLFAGHARVRRVTGIVLGCLLFVGLAFSSVIASWLLRGQDAQEAANLTGRTDVWSQVFALHRPAVETVFGSGLSNQSFNGLPIDSNWVASFLDMGYFGIVVQAALLLSVVVAAVFRRRSPARALALFLVTYCMAASVTEVALSSPTVYLLDLVVAASLVMPVPARSHR